MATKNVEIKFGQVYDLPVEQIDVPWDWNVRSGNWKQGSTDESQNDFNGLVHSIQTKGQDTPVQVVPAGPKAKVPFRLIVGFRRMAAIKQLGLTTIKAIVLDMSPAEQRENNIRENTGRADLKGADLAFGLAELERDYAHEGKAFIQSAVAQSLGINQGYCNMLCKIMKAVKPEITSKWRESPVVIPIQAMNKLTEVKPDDQPEAFAKMLEAQSTKSDGRSKKGKEQRLLDAAEKIGKMLGGLVREGFIQVTDLDASSLEFWKVVNVSIPEEMKEIPENMVKAVSNGYNEGLKAPAEKKSKKEKTA